MIFKFIKDIIVKLVKWFADMADRSGLKRNQFLTILIAVIIALAIAAYLIVSFIAKKVALNLDQALMIFFIVIIALTTVSYVVVSLFLFKFAKSTFENTNNLLLLNVLLFYEKTLQAKTADITDATAKLLEHERISKDLQQKLALLFPEAAKKLFGDEVPFDKSRS